MMQRSGRNRGQVLRNIAVGLATAAGAAAGMYVASKIPGLSVDIVQTVADVPYHAANFVSAVSRGYDALTPWGFRAIGDSFNYMSSGVRNLYNNSSPAVDWIFGGLGALGGAYFGFDIANDNLS